MAMAKPRQPFDQRPQPRLCLVTPAAADPAALAADLAAALAAADIAAVLLRLPDADDGTLIARVKTIVPAAQRAGAALILHGHAAVVPRAGADGAHLSGIAEFKAAVAHLKPDRIAGVGGLETRHDAMLAAEAGADYVMFGEPDARGLRPGFDAVIERVSWWAEVVETPCLGYAAALDEMAPLAQAGADFVAAGDWLFADPRGLAQATADAAQRLRLAEHAA